MDTITDIRVCRVAWSPVAEQMLEQMSPADQALIQAAVDQISRHFDPHRLTLIEATRDGDKPFYVLPVASRLLAFIEHGAEDHFRVLDVMRAEQLDAWREKPGPGPRDTPS
jgi:hypothetical protein